MDTKIPAAPLPDWKSWNNRARELAGFKGWLEKFVAVSTIVKNVNPSTPLVYPNQRFRYPTTPDANTYCGCGPAVTYFSAMSK